MVQALMETIFDICYLTGVITAGILMISHGDKNRLVRKFGIMAVLLGAGDAFHLIPRMYALWTSGLEAHAASLGIGKLITSITMTVFYLILYYIWRERYQIQGYSKTTIGMWILTILRAVLCLFPQNEWLSYHQPLDWGVIRNIPFTVMGIWIIVLFIRETRKSSDRVFRFMPLAIALSFGFYIPVVLFAGRIPIIGMLMMPKTLAYVWIVVMGWRLQHKPQKIHKAAA